MRSEGSISRSPKKLWMSITGRNAGITTSTIALLLTIIATVAIFIVHEYFSPLRVNFPRIFTDVAGTSPLVHFRVQSEGVVYERAELISSADKNSLIFSAKLVRLDNQTSLRLTQEAITNLFPGFPGGEYVLRFGPFLNRTCFTQAELEADFFDNLTFLNPGSDYCGTTAYLHAQIVIPGGQLTREVCKSSTVAGSQGYWSHGLWNPSKCKWDRKVARPTPNFMKKLAVYIAGDSLSRGMFPHICNYFGAFRNWSAVKSGKISKQHCCTDDYSVCLFWRMTWFPRVDFFPNTFKMQVPDASTHCSDGSGEIASCKSSVPRHAFDWEHSAENVEVWHWLFYGSHSPAYGVSNSSCSRLLSQGNLSSSGEHVLVFGTPAVNEALIPDNFVATQRKTRNNARIALRNVLLESCTDVHFLDLFPMTFALPLDNFVDAVHFAKAYASVARAISQIFATAVR